MFDKMVYVYNMTEKDYSGDIKEVVGLIKTEAENFNNTLNNISNKIMILAVVISIIYKSEKILEYISKINKERNKNKEIEK